jgi:HK97 family phage major capsid protein
LVRAPFIDPGGAGFTPEGEEIDENEIDSSEITISTGKVTILTCVSREQYRQTGVSELLSTELRTAVIAKANTAFLSQPTPAAGSHTPPPGLLVQEHQEGGEITDNLDALSDAVATIENKSGTADLIVTIPLSWAAVSKLKVGDGSNASLLGPPAVAATRQLLSIPVAVSPSVGDGVMLVADRKAILSAVGGLTVATSEHAAFRRDSITTRITWRFGATVARPRRVVALTVSEPTGRRRRRGLGRRLGRRRGLKARPIFLAWG